MSLTGTLNGTVGRTSESYTRRVVATLAVASAESDQEAYDHVTIRSGALDGTPDTTLPKALSLDPVVVAKALVIRTVNSALFRVVKSYDPGDGVIDEEFHVMVGDPVHEEGVFVLFGSNKVTTLEILEVGADRTEIEVWAVGTES